MVGFFVRAKRVTELLNDQAKARLVGTQLSYVSSGSEHSAAGDVDESPCLSELVHGFLEEDDDGPSERSLPGYESDSDRVDSVNDRSEAVESVLKMTLYNYANAGDVYRSLLLSQVLKATDKFSSLRSQKSILRRKVTSFLREIGYNAAICKTKWDSSGGLTAGNYEYIDVINVHSKSATSRYIIDLDFASEFEIARPTSVYTRLIQSLPRVFVGKSDELKTIVKSMCDEGKRSLKSRDLSLPPWRKNRYMQNKWFGPYRRTVNPIPSATSTSTASVKVIPQVNGVNCRSVGFDVGVNTRLFVRTR